MNIWLFLFIVIIIWLWVASLIGLYRPYKKVHSSYSAFTSYFPQGIDIAIRLQIRKWWIQMTGKRVIVEGIVQDIDLQAFCDMHANYDDVTLGESGGVKFGLVADPNGVQHILAKNFDNYVKPPAIKEWLPFLGSGIFTENGEIWSTQRKIARPHFVKDELDHMIPIFNKHGMEVIKILEQHCNDGTAVEIQELFLRFTLDSVGEILFGANLDSLHNQRADFVDAFNYVSEAGMFRALFPLWKLIPDRRYAPATQVLFEYCNTLVKQALSDPNIESRQDLLAHFIKNEGPSATKTVEYLRDMLQNFLLAGRDSTGVLLTWLFYFLSTHRDVCDKVVNEIDAVVGKGQPEHEHISDLRYLKQVLNETLRLCPSVPVNMRMSLKPDVLPNGAPIKANTIVGYQSIVMHRLTKLWGDDALKFDPSRWEHDRIMKVHSFAFVPFHAGPRICLGQNFAYTESRVLTTLILQRYRFELVPDQVIEHQVRLNLFAKYGVKMYVKRRDAPIQKA